MCKGLAPHNRPSHNGSFLLSQNDVCLNNIIARCLGRKFSELGRNSISVKQVACNTIALNTSDSEATAWHLLEYHTMSWFGSESESVSKCAVVFVRV